MDEVRSLKRIVAASFATLALAGGVIAYMASTASAQGRTIDGTFCMPTVNGVMQMFCMQTTFEDQTAEGYTNHPATLTLDPGTYWLTVHDNSTGHDFALRSCPGSTSPCVAGVGVPVQEVTSKADDCMTSTDPNACATGVTVKLLLKAGTYRLFCDVGNNNDFTTTGFHESHGMYVDINVVGQD